MNSAPSPQLPPLAVIAGPTASGKSAVALALAEAVGGVVINADASQCYADLRVLTARPSAADETRAEHRLFGTIDAAVAWSAADWARQAAAEVAAAQAAERLPILVGGSGLYIRTLLEGIAPVPAIDPALRAAVRNGSVDENYAALTAEDPDTAASLRPSDSARIARALEVKRSTGRSIAEWRREKSGGIAQATRLLPLLLLPPRAALRARCDLRLTAMFDGGAIEEAAALVARGLDPALPAMRAIGVREIAAFVAGGTTRAAALAAAQMATRRYAKRQFTWFGNQSPADWPRIGGQLSDDLGRDIVIKLRNMALTG